MSQTDKILRLPQVLDNVGLKKSAIYNRIKAGQFPPPIKLGTHASGWPYTESLNSLIRVMNRLGRGYSFEALRAKILFTEGIHSNKQKRPRFERKREPEPVEMGYGLPCDAIGYGVPVMEKVRPMRAPEAYDPHKHEKREKNYGADISTLIRMIEAGEL